MTRRLASQRGFTLVETLVAVVLLGIIVVAIMGGFSAISLAAKRHQISTTLDLLARTDAEYIKSQTYDDVQPATYSVVSAPSGYSISHLVLYFDPKTGTFAAGNGENGLQEVVITVSGPLSTSEQLDILKDQP
jgi:prepilin-type N-terminal cleavage/methylation domain-containing protein